MLLAARGAGSAPAGGQPAALIARHSATATRSRALPRANRPACWRAATRAELAQQVFTQIQGFSCHGFQRASMPSTWWRVCVAQAALAGSVHCSAPEQPAHGVLRAGATGARFAPARRGGAAGGHPCQRMGLHGGNREAGRGGCGGPGGRNPRGGCVRARRHAPAGARTCRRSRSSGHPMPGTNFCGWGCGWCGGCGRTTHTRWCRRCARMGRSATLSRSGAPAECPLPRSAAWRWQTPSPAWASRASKRSGRSAHCATPPPPFWTTQQRRAPRSLTCARMHAGARLPARSLRTTPQSASLKAHPVQFSLPPCWNATRAIPCNHLADESAHPAGHPATLALAGALPATAYGTASGIVFITLEGRNGCSPRARQGVGARPARGSPPRHGTPGCRPGGTPLRGHPSAGPPTGGPLPRHLTGSQSATFTDAEGHTQICALRHQDPNFRELGILSGIPRMDTHRTASKSIFILLPWSSTSDLCKLSQKRIDMGPTFGDTCGSQRVPPWANPLHRGSA